MEMVFFIVIFAGFFLVILFIFFNLKCPNCKKWRGIERIAKKTIGESRWLYVDKMRITYRCTYCGHVWDVEGPHWEGNL